jgi:hypothetical protein
MSSDQDPGGLCNLHWRYVGGLDIFCKRITEHSSVLSAVVDLYLAIYPTVILPRLQMSIKKKLALCAALGLGAV